MAYENLDAWLEPLDGDACGDDLEYDPEFLELDQVAAGKPETQFAPAEPPLWPQVRELAEGLLGRTRDLRVGMLWGRASLNLDGLEALAPTLKLLNGWLDRFWDEVHPRNDPDDGDTFARLSVMGGLDKLDALLGDVRQCLVLPDRRLGGLRLREIEIALERLSPRDDESPRTLGQIQGMLSELPDLAGRIRSSHAAAVDALKQLQRTMSDRFGIEMSVDVRALRGMLDALQQALPDEASADADAGAGADGGAQSDGNDGSAGDAPVAARRRGGGGGGVHSIDSRQDAVKALQMVCAYLERSEPTNPAQLLLRRAEKLIDKSFLQLVRDLAPDALSEVARIMGVDPDSIESIDRG
jgi:type VI secretion system protein ImpA